MEVRDYLLFNCDVYLHVFRVCNFLFFFFKSVNLDIDVNKLVCSVCPHGV